MHYIRQTNICIHDQPLVSREFIEEAKDLNLPVVWIDHHDVDVNADNVYYYNPVKSEKKSSEPVTYLCWQITGKKEDLWIALCGCIADNFLPEFYEEFCKENKEMCKENAKTAFEVLYKAEIGRVARIMNFALKDRTSNVVKMLKFLLKIKSPCEISAEEQKNFMLFRFNQVNKKYQKLIEKAKKFVSGKNLVYFQYGGDLSLSAELANELSYLHPEKIIVGAYIKGAKANISIRGKNVRELTEKAISGLNATGGGHEDATGAKVNLEDLTRFKERIESLVKLSEN